LNVGLGSTEHTACSEYAKEYAAAEHVAPVGLLALSAEQVVGMDVSTVALYAIARDAQSSNSTWFSAARHSCSAARALASVTGVGVEIALTVAWAGCQVNTRMAAVASTTTTTRISTSRTARTR
jgi:hypothetical protein